MKSNCPLVADQIVACVATARAPTLIEVTDLAARIWIEGARDRSRSLWDRLTPAAGERRAALRAADLALNGHRPDGGQRPASRTMVSIVQ